MKSYCTVLLLLISLNVSSQTVFQNISFDEAVTQARKTGKLVLIQLESLDCEKCNYVAARGYESAALAKRVAEEFIAIKIDSKNSDRNILNGLYDLSNTSFGTFFIDGDKNLIHRINKTTDNSNDYLEEFGVARFKNSEVMKLNIFSEDYKKFKSNDHLERWIWARTSLNLNNDSLLNIYADNLPKDSLNSVRVLDFIARQAPQYASKADAVLRKSSDFNKVWFAIPVSERISLNRRIISRSMQAAIQYKNEGYAYYVANFARGTYDDKNEGIATYNYQFMKYYEGVVDIDKYMDFAKVYLDLSLLKNTPQDVVRKDSIRRLELMKNAKVQTITTPEGKKVQGRSFAFTAGGQYYTNILNEAAWFIYQNTTNSAYLKKGLEWASKGNEYSEKFEAIDTEARLLYKLDRRKEAIELMEKAIAIKNDKIKIPTAFTSLDTVLKNMKEGKDVIDVK